MTTSQNFCYTNAVELAVSPYDFVLKFMRNEAENTGTGSEPRLVLADSMVVAMSPAHAKAMLPAIYNAVLEYEKQFGKIGLLPEMQEKFDTAFGKLVSKS